jgi:hypothetical protein
MGDLVAAPVQERKGGVPAPHSSEFGRKVGELVGDKMHHLPFALDAAARSDHGCAYHPAAKPLKHLRPLLPCS